MKELAAHLVVADASVSHEVVFAIIILLALVVLGVSTWLFRSRLRYRKVVSQTQLVKRCPNCNAVMEPGASFCPNCGTRVPQVTTVTQ